MNMLKMRLIRYIQLLQIRGMFSVTEATLSKTAEGMKAKVTLKGTGYDVLYLGSDEDAEKDDGKNWITSL